MIIINFLLVKHLFCYQNHAAWMLTIFKKIFCAEYALLDSSEYLGFPGAYIYIYIYMRTCSENRPVQGVSVMIHLEPRCSACSMALTFRWTIVELHANSVKQNFSHVFRWRLTRIVRNVRRTEINNNNKRCKWFCVKDITIRHGYPSMTENSLLPNIMFIRTVFLIESFILRFNSKINFDL